VQAELFDQPVDLAGGDPVDIGLLHHRDQGLLGAPTRLQEAREVAALAQLGDGQLDLADPGVPGPRAIAVAVGEPLRGPLTSSAPILAATSASMSWAAIQAPTRAARQRARRPAACRQVGQQSSWASRPSWCLLRRSVEQTDDHEARGGRTHIRPRGLATPRPATRPAVVEVGSQFARR
jgi:hypothetical protein